MSAMPARFESKVVVVTGGSSGIGRAVAGRVAAEGAAVVIGARHLEAGEAAAFGPVQELDAEECSADLDQNLTSVFYGFKHQVPALLAAGGGSIVDHAGLAGVVGIGSGAAVPIDGGLTAQ
jgi:NADP-dependent 3-hydroxy acid dehydrogenase YdfG